MKEKVTPKTVYDDFLNKKLTKDELIEVLITYLEGSIDEQVRID